MRVATLAARASLVAMALGALPVRAQQPSGTRPQPRLDRTREPKPDPTPRLRVPAWTEMRLANGAQLVVVERHGLPLVSFTITFVGGAHQLVPGEKTGVGTFVASMLKEGTKTKSGDELANAMQLLGSTVNINVGGESGSVGFTAIKDKFDGMLALLADIVVNPSFPADALERLRAQTLVTLQQDRDRTDYLASIAFPKVVYSTAHPYGRTMSEATVKAITREDLVSFHRQYFQPGRAVIVVVGDVQPTEVKQTIERALAAWPAGGTRPTFSYPPMVAPKTTTIYLVDKPGAEQSSFQIGLAGPPRTTPDYYALRVMSQIFGELFQSRLNANIREQKGYSYGVYSNIGFGRGPGPIITAGDIKTAQTDSALVEWIKEIRGIRGERALTDAELAAGKAALTQSLPERFSSVSAVSSAVREIYVEGLPKDYYQRFVDAVNAVTKEDVVRVARRYLDPAHLAIVIVGDRKQIEGPLTKTKIAPVVVIEP